MECPTRARAPITLCVGEAFILGCEKSVTFALCMPMPKIEPIELEAQIRHVRRILTLQLNQYKVTGTAALSEEEIQRSLDTLRALERKGIRNLDYYDLARFQRILLRLPASDN